MNFYLHASDDGGLEMRRKNHGYATEKEAIDSFLAQIKGYKETTLRRINSLMTDVKFYTTRERQVKELQLLLSKGLPLKTD